MNRINAIFSELRSQNRQTIMPFLTAGYPSLQATAHAVMAAEKAGAAICELGIPFSDPIADGPVIQASMTQALAGGVTPGKIFEMVRGLRPRVKAGLVAMVSYSIVYRMGTERFIRQALEAGFDGFIFPDLSLEETEPTSALVTKLGGVLALLAAPNTPLERVKRIAAASTGFIYVLARVGITGERAELPPDLTERLTQLREMTNLPLAVGFGISTAEHVRLVTRHADAAIVGSATVKRMSAAAEQKADDAVIGQAAGDLVAELVRGLK